MNPVPVSASARSISRYASPLVGVCSLAMFRPANRSSTFPMPTRGTPAAASRSSSVVPTGSSEKSLRCAVRRYAPGVPVNGRAITRLTACSPTSMSRAMPHARYSSASGTVSSCGIARDMLVGEHAVSRVIARPFTGTPGAYRRTAQRKDFSLEPVGTTLLDRLAAAGVPRVGIGKVDDLFAGRNIASEHTPTNADAYRLIERALNDAPAGFIFVNVIEFDQTWGHRNDVPGFHEGLKELDAWIPRLLARLQPDDLVMLTADHGNDPTTPSTDHSREVVPLLVLGPNVHPVPLGTRRTFADMGQTVGEYFGLPPLAAGRSFLKDVSA